MNSHVGRETIGTFEELDKEVEKYFPYYNGYDPERKLPEVGDVILLILQNGYSKVAVYKGDKFLEFQYDVIRWWPTRLKQDSEKTKYIYPE